VPAPVVPRPVAPELADPVPAVVVSIIGATTAESIDLPLVVFVSTVEGVVNTAESLDTAPPSVPLLQAANEPARATTISIFFMFFY
jgi:hypothetical protein